MSGDGIRRRARSSPTGTGAMDPDPTGVSLFGSTILENFERYFVVLALIFAERAVSLFL